MVPVRASNDMRGLAKGAWLERLLFCLALGISGLAAAVGAKTGPEAFQAQWDQAEALRQEAAAAGFEWLNTADLLHEAMARFESGETEAAWRLLQQGEAQAERAREQAASEADAWQRRVVR